MEQVASPTGAPEIGVLNDIQRISVNMNGWLKFLGIVNIISGALAAISVVGILVAWLPIWLGILLIQAGSKASSARLTHDPRELVVMMDKLRLYFVIQGILIIVMIAIVLMGFMFFGTIVTRMMDAFPA